MGIFFIYSIKVALCLTAFYLVFKLFLSRDTFHGFNRFVLLSLMLLSLLLPAVQVSMATQSPAFGGFVVVENAVATVVDADGGGFAPTLAQVCFAIYIIGVAFFLVRELWMLAGLSRLIRGGRVVSRDGGVNTIVVDGDVAPFSWFGNIVISASDYAGNPREILAHERAHVAGLHSADVLACDVLVIFQWFNPAAWLMKAELQNVHEYIADRAVLDGGVDATGYQLLLIRKAVGDKLFSMANNLEQSSLKKRITMMTKRNSNPLSRFKGLIALPVAAVAVAAFATPKAESLSSEIKAQSDALVEAVAPAAKPAVQQAVAQAAAAGNTPSASADTLVLGNSKSRGGGKVYDACETLPEFAGGQRSMLMWLKENIKYPEAAEKAGKQGRVVVQFIVETDGTVANPEIVRSVDAELDAEALRVVSAMPKWTPGRQDGKPVAVRYTLPIIFRTTGGDTAQPKHAVDAQPQTVSLQGAPYMLVDGKPVTTLDGIDTNTISRIEVFKDKANTVDKYGEVAKNGVVMVTTKAANK